MVIGRLENRLVVSQQLQMLFEDIDVVALRIQCRHLLVGSLCAGVQVVIVGADRQYLPLSQDSRDPRGQGH